SKPDAPTWVASWKHMVLSSWEIPIKTPLLVSVSFTNSLSIGPLFLKNTQFYSLKLLEEKKEALRRATSKSSLAGSILREKLAELDSKKPRPYGTIHASLLMLLIVVLYPADGRAELGKGVKQSSGKKDGPPVTSSTATDKKSGGRSLEKKRKKDVPPPRRNIWDLGAKQTTKSVPFALKR
ncbi:hypothetical protein S83_051570, partial [Arachis hypogaea]